jgi:8-oxo-dGTP pyrophosphatase MutT (NUDIX family)
MSAFKASSYLRHFHASNRHDLNKFVPFLISEKQLGWIAKDIVPLLPKNIFQSHNNGIALNPDFDSFDKRSDALSKTTDILLKHFGKQLRHEMYPVIAQWGDEPLAQIDRVAVPWFGVRGFGIHVNGFTRKRDGIHLWVGERAADRLIDPGKLDNLIGGGQPIGLTLEQNLCKEAQEEAGINADLAMSAKPVREIRYLVERHGGLRNDVLFIYDLELPDGYTPHNTDGEVAAFHLMPLAEVAAIVHDTDKFKFNCNLVIIDFLMRHGFLTPEHAEYGALHRLLY